MRTLHEILAEGQPEPDRIKHRLFTYDEVIAAMKKAVKEKCLAILETYKLPKP